LIAFGVLKAKFRFKVVVHDISSSTKMRNHSCQFLTLSKPLLNDWLKQALVRPVLLRSASTPASHRMVREEDGVQFAPFRDPGEVPVVLDVRDSGNVRLRQPPGGFVLAHVSQEGIEMNPTRFRCHWELLRDDTAISLLFFQASRINWKIRLPVCDYVKTASQLLFIASWW
jgi:hypothetical protein